MSEDTSPPATGTSTPAISPYLRRIAWIFVATGTVGLAPCSYGFYFSIKVGDGAIGKVLLFWLFLCCGLLLYAGYIRTALAKQPSRHERLLWTGTIIYNILCVPIFLFIIIATPWAFLAACWNVLAMVLGVLALDDLRKRNAAPTGG